MMKEFLSLILVHLDKSLEPSLAVSLAALAITVAIFLVAYHAELAEDIARVKRGGDTPDPAKEERLKAGRQSTRDMTRAFYAFVVFLLETLTLDGVADNPAESWPRYLIFYADLIISTASLAAGLFWFWRGGRDLRRIVMKDA
jgi:hypothetical protein